MRTVVSGVLRLPVDGMVVLQGLAIQGFAAGDKPWQFAISIDGVEIVRTGQRIAMQDMVPLYARKMITGAPRDVPIAVTWEGDTTITLNACDVTVLGYPNTKL